MSQLPLDISLPPRYAEDDFLVAECNQAAWSALQQWDKDSLACGLIKGAKSSGKTHLAHIWADRNNATVIEAATLINNSEPEKLFTAHNTQNLAIDNAQMIPDAASLFHLLNFLQGNTHYRLLLTVDTSACWDHFTLPDLRSRLQALPQTEIHEPDDALLSALLVKSFQDKQVAISQASLTYLIPRIERSFDGVKQVIDALDKHAIAKKRPITRVLIQEVLTNP
ncbi:MAG: hypothetical protein P8P30_02785 [Rickettsiales bacterium]|nr:hypothetical protein [Rickettsiales bacterium]